MDNKKIWVGEVIHVSWDRDGRISHHIEGTQDGHNDKYWTLPLSSVVLIGHQLGAEKPSFGLNICSRIIDILVQEKYQYLPIEKTLKSAKIEFLYVDNHCAGLHFDPKYSYVHDNDKLELGSCQLVSNYYFHVFSQSSQLSQIMVKYFTFKTLEAHFSALEGLLRLGKIGVRKDISDPIISQTNGMVGNRIIKDFYTLDERDDDVEKETLVEKINSTLVEKIPYLQQKYAELHELWME